MSVEWTALAEKWPDVDESVVLANEEDWVCADVHYVGRQDGVTLIPAEVSKALETGDRAALSTLLRRAFQPHRAAMLVDPDDVFGAAVEPFFAFDLTRFTHWRPMPDLGMGATTPDCETPEASPGERWCPHCGRSGARPVPSGHEKCNHDFTTRDFEPASYDLTDEDWKELRRRCAKP